MRTGICRDCIHRRLGMPSGAYYCAEEGGTINPFETCIAKKSKFRSIEKYHAIRLATTFRVETIKALLYAINLSVRHDDFDLRYMDSLKTAIKQLESLVRKHERSKR